MKRINLKTNSVKLKLSILGCVLSIIQVNGQTNSVSKYINNDSIKFDLLMVMPDFENGVYYSNYALVVNGLDSVGKVMVQGLSKSQWMTYLQNNKSDWAANIILYSIYRKSAGIFRVAVKSRDSWIENSREADLAYWKSFLQ